MERLTDDPIVTERLVAEVMRNGDGALALFCGVVRDHSRGRAVESILYEAYRSMAEKELDRILGELRAKYPAVALAAVHRLGRLAVGEISVAVAASSPHRPDAFAACRETIDRIKESVPIWKKERSSDGDEWV